MNAETNLAAGTVDGNWRLMRLLAAASRAYDVAVIDTSGRR